MTPRAQRIRTRLEARRRELLARYKSHLEQADEDVAVREPDVLDSANDQWDARVVVAMSEADRRALMRVTAALQHLDHGTYGLCEECGARIEPDRLRAIPEARECIECATELQPRRAS